MQPPWQVGIVRKVLNGLKREGSRGKGSGRGHDTSCSYRDGGRHDGETSEHSSLNGSSSLEEDSDNGDDAVAAVEAGEDEDEEEVDEGEEEDRFEVDDVVPPDDSRGGRVFSLATRSKRFSKASTRSNGVGSGVGGAGGDGNVGGYGGTTATSAVLGGDEIPAIAVSAAAATPTDSALVVAATTTASAAAKRKGARVFIDGAVALPEIPEALKAGVESRLEETCCAFRTSIRRAVLNYVLLDARQRDRLGTSSPPPPPHPPSARAPGA